MQAYLTIYTFTKSAVALPRRFTEEGNYLLTRPSNTPTGSITDEREIDNFINEYMEADIFTNIEVKNRFPSLDMTFIVPVEDARPNLGNIYKSERKHVYLKYSIPNEGNKMMNYYYFIRSEEKISSRSIRFIAHMDVLNTYTPGVVYPSNGDYDTFTFDTDTLVMREHRDRFQKLESGEIVRLIDRADEGFSTPTFIKSKEMIAGNTPEGAGEAYLVYKTDEELTPDNLENPLVGYVVYQNGVNAYGTGDNTQTAFNFATNGDVGAHVFLWKWMNPALEFNNFTISSQDGEVLIKEYDIDLASFAQCDGVLLSGDYDGNAHQTTIYIDYVKGAGSATHEFTLIKRDSVVFAGTGGAQPYFHGYKVNFYIKDIYGATDSANLYDSFAQKSFPSDFTRGNGGSSTLLSDFSKVDRYDPRNVKIVALPYDVVKWTGNAEIGYRPTSPFLIDTLFGFIELPNLDMVLSSICATISLDDVLNPNISNPRAYSSRDDNLESKQFSSAFYNDTLVYDDNSLEIAYENILWDVEASTTFDWTDRALLQVYFQNSSQVSSKCIFAITDLSSPIDITKIRWSLGNGGYVDYDSPMTFSNVLVCARNNELCIYTSDYLNYIRNGYNFDIKSNKRQLVSSLAGTATNFGVSLAQRSYVGVAYSLTNLYQNISAAVQRDWDVEKRLYDKAISAIGVEGSDNFDIFYQYSKNKLWRVIKEPSPITKQYMLDLFHYYGYSTKVRKRPNIFSRVNFNFLQAEIEINNSPFIPQDIMDEIKDKFKKGVFYMHRYALKIGASAFNYDFDFSNANYETWLI